MSEEIKIQINTGYNKGWITDGNVRFIGYFHDEEGNYRTNEFALKYFSSCNCFEQLNILIDNINGVFSVIIIHEGSVFIACDKSRFFPVFYCCDPETIQISDDFYELIKNNRNAKTNAPAVEQFLSGAFTTGSSTLVEDIYQLQPGEIAEFVNGKKTVSRFKPLTYPCNKPIPKKKWEEIAKDALFNAGKKLVGSLRKRHILLPLSGGYDSRLIACWLKSNNLNNVTCFTFGRKDTKDISISRKVADKLGYKWHYIEYNKTLIDGFIDTPEFNRFYKYMSRGTSMFYMQEYFALRELKKQGIIEDGFVAIPGHSGDLLGGSQLYKIVPPKHPINNIEKIIQKKVFNQTRLSKEQEKRLRQGISGFLKQIKLNKGFPRTDPVLFEEWLIREKLAKYNLNSSHVFDFFGGEVRFPFWDDELVRIWLSMPLKERLFNKKYNEILEKEYFEPLGVNFHSRLQPSQRDLTILKVKNSIRPFLPLKIKKRFVKKNDWVLYDEITELFLKQLENNGICVNDNGSSYIYRILHWYLFKIEKEFDIKHPKRASLPCS